MHLEVTAITVGSDNGLLECAKLPRGCDNHGQTIARARQGWDSICQEQRASVMELIGMLARPLGMTIACPAGLRNSYLKVERAGGVRFFMLGPGSSSVTRKSSVCSRSSLSA